MNQEQLDLAVLRDIFSGMSLETYPSTEKNSNTFTATGGPAAYGKVKQLDSCDWDPWFTCSSFKQIFCWIGCLRHIASGRYLLVSITVDQAPDPDPLVWNIKGHFINYEDLHPLSKFVRQ